MLYNEHCKAGKELQRKIDKLKDEGKDPSLPQLPELSQKVLPPKPNSNSNTYHGSPRVNTSSPQPLRLMTDSQNTGDESFMLLGGQRVRLLALVFAQAITKEPNFLSQIPETHSTSSGILCKEC